MIKITLVFCCVCIMNLLHAQDLRNNKSLDSNAVQFNSDNDGLALLPDLPTLEGEGFQHWIAPFVKVGKIGDKHFARAVLTIINIGDSRALVQIQCYSSDGNRLKRTDKKMLGHKVSQLKYDESSWCRVSANKPITVFTTINYNDLASPLLSTGSKDEEKRNRNVEIVNAVPFPAQ